MSSAVQIPALLLGSQGPLPFAGHLRTVVRGSQAALWIAGRVGESDEPVIQRYDRAMEVQTALRGLAEGSWAGSDRHGLLRGAWEILSGLPVPTLSLLLVAVDARGVGLSGVGLSGVFGWFDRERTPIVESEHPLLGPPGLPESLPGVLTLTRSPERVIGRPWEMRREPPRTLDALKHACGERP